MTPPKSTSQSPQPAALFPYIGSYSCDAAKVGGWGDYRGLSAWVFHAISVPVRGRVRSDTRGRRGQPVTVDTEAGRMCPASPEMPTAPRTWETQQKRFTPRTFSPVMQVSAVCPPEPRIHFCGCKSPGGVMCYSSNRRYTQTASLSICSHGNPIQTPERCFPIALAPRL